MLFWFASNADWRQKYCWIAQIIITGGTYRVRIERGRLLKSYANGCAGVDCMNSACRFSTIIKEQKLLNISTKITARIHLCHYLWQTFRTLPVWRLFALLHIYTHKMWQPILFNNHLTRTSSTLHSHSILSPFGPGNQHGNRMNISNECKKRKKLLLSIDL